MMARAKAISTEEATNDKSGEEDAMMDDVGRPPDRIGDKGTPSWSERVKASSGGGMPYPEEMVDESFVDERIQLDFPDGEDGEPVITVGSEVIEAMSNLWKRCLFVKVLGRSFQLPVLMRRLRELWNPKGGMLMIDLPRQFFMIKFEEEGDYLAAISGGPWKIYGCHLLMQTWSAKFDPTVDEIVTTPVWVRVANLPMNLYHKSIFKGIAKGLGVPVKVDPTTLRFERGRFARICVEINLKKPLKGSVLVNEERYYVSYEGLSQICPLCGLFGHLAQRCTKSQGVVNPSSKSLTVVDNQKRQGRDEEGFSQVKRPARRHRGHRLERNDTNSSIESGRQVGEIPASNVFDRLQEDTGIPPVAGVTMDVEGNEGNVVNQFEVGVGITELPSCVKESTANIQVEGVTMDIEGSKENVSFQNEAEAGKVELQTGVKEDLVSNRGVVPVLNVGEPSRGGKEGIHSRTKQKFKKSGKPTRGLVFGLTKGDKDSSILGKRQWIGKEKNLRLVESCKDVILGRAEIRTPLSEKSNIMEASNTSQPHGLSGLTPEKPREVAEDGVLGTKA